MNNAARAISAEDEIGNNLYPLRPTIACPDVVHSDQTTNVMGPQMPPPGVSVRFIESICQYRNQRRDHFHGLSFSDPAWDILLRLYAAFLDQHRLTITNLVIYTGIPSTSVLRWLDSLGQQNLVVRGGDPLDARRVFISLSPLGIGAMNRYFAATGVRSIFV